MTAPELSAQERETVERAQRGHYERPGSPTVTWDSDGRPHWHHNCTDGASVVQIPLAPGRWQIVEPGRSLSPSLHCTRCGTHGWWTGGRWLDTDAVRQQIAERRADSAFVARLEGVRARHADDPNADLEHTNLTSLGESGMVEEIATALAAARAGVACTCTPYPYGTGPEEDCPVHGREAP